MLTQAEHRPDQRTLGGNSSPAASSDEHNRASWGHLDEGQLALCSSVQQGGARVVPKSGVGPQRVGHVLRVEPHHGRRCSPGGAAQKVEAGAGIQLGVGPQQHGHMLRSKLVQAGACPGRQLGQQLRSCSRCNVPEPPGMNMLHASSWVDEQGHVDCASCHGALCAYLPGKQQKKKPGACMSMCISGTGG